MNLVWRELVAGRKALLIWSICMVAFLAMTYVEFSAYYQNPEMLAILELMPREVLDALGMAEANLTTFSGYTSMMVIFINLMLAVYAVMLGHGILAKEEIKKTAGFLLTLPVTRPGVITGKLVAAALSCFILLAVVVASTWVAASFYEAEANFLRFLALVATTTLVLMLVFLMLGMALAAATNRHKLSGGVAIGLVFTLYLLSIVVDLSEGVAFLWHLTPFKYFPAHELLKDLRIGSLPLALSGLIIAVSVVVTYQFYARRDLQH